MDKYRLDPDFVQPERTPADFFSFRGDPGPDGRREALDELLAGWKGHGVAQCRFTVTGKDDAPYPPGLWFEGWKDPKARQLPFGEAVNGEGPIYPCLTASSSTEGE